MSYRLPRLVVAAMVAAAPFVSAHPAETQVERGKYLVEVGGCTDCHTPGNFLGHPDMTRYPRWLRCRLRHSRAWRVRPART